MAHKVDYVPQDSYKVITDAVVEALEAGVAPWVCPWDRSLGVSHNGASGHIYQGINIWMTYIAAQINDFNDPRWYTFNQARQKGGSVKGQHGTKIIKWLFVAPKQKTGESDADFKARKDRKVPLLKTYTVFNHEQVTWAEGKEPKLTKTEPVDPAQVNADAAEFLATVGAVIKHGGARAAYDTKKDIIKLPVADAFNTIEDYFATAFHEVIHWTGHADRCDRDLKGRFGSEAYAAEELVAEMGAAFLCGDYHIDGKLQHPEYVGHWLKVLKGDKYAVFTAARLARNAANFTKVEPKADAKADTKKAVA